MLVLSRRQDESIIVGDDFLVTVLEIKQNRVRLLVTSKTADQVIKLPFPLQRGAASATASGQASGEVVMLGEDVSVEVAAVPTQTGPGISIAFGGLLLIATSNNPECLDPAINNRPGRFDLAIEGKCPDAGMRAEFFRRGSLAGTCGPRAFDKLVSLSAGLSFSHLREIESQSGLSAVQDRRSSRSEQDVLRAAECVADTHAEARRGFPAPTAPFGLSPVRGTRIPN